jgi:hypothetical protein
VDEARGQFSNCLLEDVVLLSFLCDLVDALTVFLFDLLDGSSLAVENGVWQVLSDAYVLLEVVLQGLFKAPIC